MASTLLRYALKPALPLALIATGNDIAIFIGVCVVFVFGMPYMAAFSTDIGRAVRGNSQYRAAAIAISQQSFVPDFVGRGAYCDGIAMVDKARRKLYVNGTIVSFADIEDTELGPYQFDQIYLEFMLSTGPEPKQRVIFDKAETAKSFVQRLRDAMQAPASDAYQRPFSGIQK